MNHNNTSEIAGLIITVGTTSGHTGGGPRSWELSTNGWSVDAEAWPIPVVPGFGYITPAVWPPLTLPAPAPAEAPGVAVTTKRRITVTPEEGR